MSSAPRHAPVTMMALSVRPRTPRSPDRTYRSRGASPFGPFGGDQARGTVQGGGVFRVGRCQSLATKGGLFGPPVFFCSVLPGQTCCRGEPSLKELASTRWIGLVLFGKSISPRLVPIGTERCTAPAWLGTDRGRGTASAAQTVPQKFGRPPCHRTDRTS
jgi:hypothetical protein